MKKPTKSQNIENNKLAKKLTGSGFYHQICHYFKKLGEEHTKTILKRANNIFKIEAPSNQELKIEVKIQKEESI